MKSSKALADSTFRIVLVMASYGMSGISISSMSAMRPRTFTACSKFAATGPSEPSTTPLIMANLKRLPETSDSS